MPGLRKLTGKQALFVKTYLANGGDSTAAYRLAYKPGGNPRNHNVAARKTLQAPAVALILGRAKTKATELISDELINRYAVDQAAIAAALARLSFSEIGDVCTLENEIYADDKGMPKAKQVLRVKNFSAMDASQRFAISKIKQDKDGQVSIELHDKRQSLVDLARVMGLITDKAVGPIDPVTGKPVDRLQPVTLQIIRKG